MPFMQNGLSMKRHYLSHRKKKKELLTTDNNLHCQITKSHSIEMLILTNLRVL